MTCDYVNKNGQPQHLLPKLVQESELHMQMV